MPVENSFLQVCRWDEPRKYELRTQLLNHSNCILFFKDLAVALDDSLRASSWSRIGLYTWR